MGLNKTNGNMYPWVTHTWNPLAGECKHNCSYCYMKRSFLGNLKKYEGEVRLFKKELETDLGFNNTIFVGSATDIFGDWVSNSIIKNILSYCRKFPNKYLFQSKNPSRFEEFIKFFPENSIIATTLETNRSYNVSKAPLPTKRYHDFLSIKYSRKMVSIEPVIDFDLDEFICPIGSSVIFSNPKSFIVTFKRFTVSFAPLDPKNLPLGISVSLYEVYIILLKFIVLFQI